MMLVLPPLEIVDYVYTDENGNWVYDPEMPSDLIPIFEKFVNSYEKTKNEQFRSVEE